MKDAEMIASDLAHVGCGCSEDEADHCTYMRDRTETTEGYCTRTKTTIATALRDAHRAGYEAAREQAAGVAADHDDGSSTPGPLAAWTIAEAIRKMEPDDA